MVRMLGLGCVVSLLIFSLLQASQSPAKDSLASTTVVALELTLEELAKYDGKNGNPAYVAVDGVIYDVSAVKAWKNGQHHGQTAGKDLTDAIKKRSPHGVKVLTNKKIVGKLVASKPTIDKPVQN